MPRKVFLSVLGTSFYRPCRYVQGVFKSDEVSFIQQAIIDLLKIPSDWDKSKDKIMIMLTKKSFELNWDKDIESREDFIDKIHKPYIGLNKILIDMGLEEMIYPICISEGENVNEIWEIFTRMFDALENEDELYLDITHSFRYLPMVVLVLCNYAKFLKNVSVKSITYGNYEGRNKDTNEAPILDLLPISLLQDWTSAATGYIKSGRADELYTLSDGIMRKIRKCNPDKWQNANALSQAITLLNDISLEFQLCMGLQVMQGTKFKKDKFDIGIAAAEIIPPLSPIVKKMVDSLSPFNNEMDVRNIFNAAKWCYEKKMYQQAMTLLREGVISYICDAIKVDIVAKNTREMISAILATFNNKGKDLRIHYMYHAIKALALPKEFFNNFSVLIELRNNINHAYIKTGTHPRIFIEIIRIKKLLDYFIHFIENTNISISSLEEFKCKPPVLINLSNHPYGTWSEEQKIAAVAYGKCIDIPFPDIDAMSDEEDIKKMADSLISQIGSYSLEYNVTVHVMGEMTLCFAIVRRLMDVGIKCIASCSRRNAEMSDGVKTSVFKFERFRTYWRDK